jgi:hypothetical protein
MTARFYALTLSLFVSLIASPIPGGLAAEVPQLTVALEPFVHDDTFAAAFFNFSSLPTDKGQLGEMLKALPLSSEETHVLAAATKALEPLFGSLRQAGVDCIYLVAGLADLHEHGGPLVVIQLKPQGQPHKVAEMLREMGSKGPWASDFDTQAHASSIVLAGSKATLARYASLASSERADLVKPLEKLANERAVVAAVICPGPDFRRVVRELWPELPGPLAPLRGELIDRWQHVELAANLPPEIKPRVVLQARDAAAASIFAQLWRDLPTAVSMFSGESRPEQTKKYVEALVAALPPKIEGHRVTLEFPSQPAEVAALRSMASQASDAALESSRRAQRIRQFKQLALAMHNYHDVNKHFPASAAICDDDGKPLLSWRVAVLPYLDQAELYKQFHLDEPWDSPHNRKLVESMPAIFADPDPKLRQLAREGKTTYQVPVGADTIFHTDRGTKFREIIDGTSKTILIVEVEPARAVVWTKPEDWAIDLQNPRQGLQRDDRPYFTAAFADGSVQIIDATQIDEPLLRALFTRAGREVIDRP